MARKRSWARDTCGVAAVEYAIIASLIGGAIVVSARTIGTNLNAVFATIGAELVSAPPPPTPNGFHGSGP